MEISGASLTAVDGGFCVAFNFVTGRISDPDAELFEGDLDGLGGGGRGALRLCFFPSTIITT